MTAGHILRDRPAVCLDITRSISRVGRGPATGIDRVELAYIRHFSNVNVPAFGVLRTALGYILLDRHGLSEAASRLAEGRDWGSPDLLSTLTQRSRPERAAAESALRKVAVGRAPKGRLSSLLQRKIGQGFTYLNVGHSHLSDTSLSAIRAGGAAKILCLVHDVIPLLSPETQRPGSVPVFETRMKAVCAHADLILTSAKTTEQSITNALQWFGPVPATAAIPLGVDTARHPAGDEEQGPYFVVVGTLDPRKGIDMLLDVWGDLKDRLGPEVPRLALIGRRGWGPAGLHKRLDRAVASGAVVELDSCTDEERVRYVANAWAVLQPSALEGYGLPVFEAAALGTPVIASDLPVYREFLGDLPVYVPSGDLYHWKKAIEQHIEQCREGPIPRNPRFDPPSWADHFAALDRLLTGRLIPEAVPADGV